MVDVSPPPPPQKKIRGLFCPRCRFVHLPILYTKLPCFGVRVRYRLCARCGCHIVTGERILRWTYPLPKDAKADVASLKDACR